MFYLPQLTEGNRETAPGGGGGAMPATIGEALQSVFSGSETDTGYEVNKARGNLIDAANALAATHGVTGLMSGSQMLNAERMATLAPPTPTPDMNYPDSQQADALGAQADKIGMRRAPAPLPAFTSEAALAPPAIAPGPPTAPAGTPMPPGLPPRDTRLDTGTAATGAAGQKAIADWQQTMANLAKQYPDEGFPSSLDDITQKAADQSKAAQASTEQVLARTAHPLAASLLGGSLAAMTQPIQLAALLTPASIEEFGGSLAIRMLKLVGTQALTQGAAAGIQNIGMQDFFARQGMSDDEFTSKVWKDIGGSALGGAIFAGLLEGGRLSLGKVFEALKSGTPSERIAAVDALDRSGIDLGTNAKADLANIAEAAKVERDMPFATTADSMRDYAQKIDGQGNAIEGGNPIFDARFAPTEEERPIMRTGVEDHPTPAMMRELQEKLDATNENIPRDFLPTGERVDIAATPERRAPVAEGGASSAPQAVAGQDMGRASAEAMQKATTAAVATPDKFSAAAIDAMQDYHHQELRNNSTYDIKELEVKPGAPDPVVASARDVLAHDGDPLWRDFADETMTDLNEYDDIEKALQETIACFGGI